MRRSDSKFLSNEKSPARYRIRTSPGGQRNRRPDLSNLRSRPRIWCLSPLAFTRGGSSVASSGLTACSRGLQKIFRLASSSKGLGSKVGFPAKLILALSIFLANWTSPSKEAEVVSGIFPTASFDEPSRATAVAVLLLSNSIVASMFSTLAAVLPMSAAETGRLLLQGVINLIRRCTVDRCSPVNLAAGLKCSGIL